MTEQEVLTFVMGVAVGIGLCTVLDAIRERLERRRRRR